MDNLCWVDDKGVIWTAKHGAILRDGEQMGIARPELVQEIARLSSSLPPFYAGPYDNHPTPDPGPELSQHSNRAEGKSSARDSIEDLQNANLVLESRLNETEARLANLESKLSFELSRDTQWKNGVNGRLSTVESTASNTFERYREIAPMVRHLEDQIREVVVNQVETVPALARLDERHSELFKAVLPLVSLEARVKNVERWMADLTSSGRLGILRQVKDEQDEIWRKLFDEEKENLRCTAALEKDLIWTGDDDEAQLMGEG